MLTLTSPVETWAHRLPAGAKLLALCLATVLLFALASPLPLTVAALIVATLTATGGPRFAAHALRMLRPLIPFVVVIALWHLWLRDPAGVPIILRMITAVAAANLVTMTTRLSDMITVLERLMRPFAGLVPPRALALAIALTIRFIPVMLDRAAQISESWRARSPRRPGWRVLPPTTMAALDDADRVAEALRARGGV
jgi:biotin transport system permease protein